MIRGAAGAWLAVSIVGGLVAMTACADDGGPRLESVVPAAARPGATVALAGSRLCGTGGDCARAAGEVTFGRNPPMLRAVVVDYSDSAAHVVVPSLAPAGGTVVIVTVDERSSNALDFEVLP